MSTVGQLLVGGERTSGDSIRSQNGRTSSMLRINLYFYSQ